MKSGALAVIIASILATQVAAHNFCSRCNRCHTCGRTLAQINASKQQPQPTVVSTQTTTKLESKIVKVTTKKPVVTAVQPATVQPAAVQPASHESPVAEAVQSKQSTTQPHPPFSNQFNYPRKIDAELQARALKEAKLLAQYSFQDNQRRWTSSNGALGHPIGVPPGYVGGTGCSIPEPTGGWKRVTPNQIHTCEPPSSRHLLVAEAVAYNQQDGVWYASRIWKPF